MKDTARYVSLALCILLLGLTTCTAKGLRATASNELLFRNWEGDISQSILDAFEEEYGIAVRYIPYESQEEAIADIRAGEAYDVVVLENQLIPNLVEDGLLGEINYQNVPNFKNISPNFRDLAYDPHNLHAIPYSWGTTGLAVRTDMVDPPITRWADLWDARYKGKIIAWPLPRYLLGIALKAQGYSLNSEDPEEIKLATQRLLELKPSLQLREWEPAVSAPYLVSGEAFIAMGQADDVTEGQKLTRSIEYVLPEEGGILWGDNFTIPANAPHKEAAEHFINFLLRPEISAQIINETYYWLPNDAALPLVNPEIRNNPAIFPLSDMLKNAEVLLPLSTEGEALYKQAWHHFLATSGTGQWKSR